MVENDMANKEKDRQAALEKLESFSKEDIYDGLMISNARNTFFHAKLLISQVGKEKAKQLFQQTKYDQGYEMGKEASKKGHSKNIAGFAEAMAGFSSGSDNRLPWVIYPQVIEKTENRVHRRVTFCYLADALLRVGADDPETFEVAKWFDANDKAIAEGFHPGLKFERTKWLLDGDPYCEFFLEEDGAPPRKKVEETKEIDAATKEQHRNIALEKLDSFNKKDLYDALMLSNGRNIFSLVKILISQVGKEKATEVIKQAKYDECYQRGKAADKKFPRTLAGFIEWSGSLSSGADTKMPWVVRCGNVKTTETSVLRRCTFCYLAEPLLKAGAEDPETFEVAKWCDANDKARAYGFHPGLKFERTKWLLDGDPYCEFLAEA